MYRAGVYDHHVPMQSATATANAAGLAKAAWGYVPEGYCWYIERYSGHCPTAATTVAVFVALGATGPSAAVDPGYQADYTKLGTGITDVVGDANQPIYVPAGYHFVFQWTGATSGDLCVASIQYSVHQIDSNIIGTPQDALQEHAAHQSHTSPLTQVATAGERAV